MTLGNLTIIGGGDEKDITPIGSFSFFNGSSKTLLYILSTEKCNAEFKEAERVLVKQHIHFFYIFLLCFTLMNFPHQRGQREPLNTG